MPTKKLVIHDNRILCHIAGMNDEIKADFNPRGNVHTVITACHGSRKTIQDK